MHLSWLIPVVGSIYLLTIHLVWILWSKKHQ